MPRLTPFKHILLFWTHLSGHPTVLRTHAQNCHSKRCCRACYTPHGVCTGHVRAGVCLPGCIGRHGEGRLYPPGCPYGVSLASSGVPIGWRRCIQPPLGVPRGVYPPGCPKRCIPHLGVPRYYCLLWREGCPWSTIASSGCPRKCYTPGCP